MLSLVCLLDKDKGCLGNEENLMVHTLPIKSSHAGLSLSLSVVLYFADLMSSKPRG